MILVTFVCNACKLIVRAEKVTCDYEIEQKGIALFGNDENLEQKFLTIRYQLINSKVH